MRRSRFLVPIVLIGATAMPATAHAAIRDDEIAGQVTDFVSGAGITGICVAATAPGPATPTRTATTLDAGLYRLPVPAGTYTISFFDCRTKPLYLPQWFDNASSAADATPVTVGKLSPLRTANAALVPGARVTGTVTDAADTAPVSGVCVIAADLASYIPHQVTYRTTTSTAGTYQLYLPDADYSVQFHDCRSTPAYLDQWWDHAGYAGAAKTLTVDAAQQPTYGGIDAALQPGSTVTGHITDDATGQPLGNMCVDGPRGPVQTDATGAYTLLDVPSGTYQLMVYQCTGLTSSGTQYATEYYHHEPNLAAATPVSVAPDSVTVVDETMRAGGAISGRVVDASTGQPVSGISVTADADDTAGDGGTTTAADGTYSLTGLYASDRYVVTFFDPKGRYPTQWWKDETAYGSGDFVSVQFGATTAGIDEALQSS